MLRKHTRNRPPKKGEMRVWNIKCVPCHEPDLYPVKDPAHGKRLINALADSQLLDTSITDNAFGLEEWDGAEWCEWCDEEGNDVDTSPLSNVQAD